MATTYIGQITGSESGATPVDAITGDGETLAYKAPCRAATTANVALSGLQTIDGVVLAASDRVLVKDQTNAVDNGIYIVSTGAWQRARDFDSNRDVTKGTRMTVVAGTLNEGREYLITTANPINVGTDNVTIEESLSSDSGGNAAAAAASAAAAAGSATAASTSATNSANSASAASTQATNASNSATSAAGSASTATTQATNAANSATAANTSATNAATSETNTAAIYDAFDDRYLGSKASAPTVDNDGNALLTGAMYWNSTNSTLNFWSGSAWNVFNVSGLAALAGATFTGAVITAASAAGGAGLRLPHGVAPTAPVNGDFWSTTAGWFGRTNGTTLQFAAAANVSSLNSMAGIAYIAGDLPYFSGTKVAARLAKGTALQTLRMNAGATDPEWATPIFSKSFESSQQTITVAGALTLAHSLGSKPSLVTLVLICTTAEQGYSINDEVLFSPGFVSGERGMSVVPDSTNINIRYGAAAPAVMHKTTGNDVAITAAKWRLVVRAWA